MATAGAFGCFDVDRRRGLWSAGAAVHARADRLSGTATGMDAPTLPGMSLREEAVADLWATGVSPEGHPTIFVRDALDELGVLTATGLRDAQPGAT